MNWKRLTIQLLTAVSAGIPLMTVRGQDCRCQPLRPPILLPTPQSLSGPGSFANPESASPLLANRRDGSWFQPLSPDHGVFHEGSPGPQVTSTSGDLTTSGDLSTPATVTENITGGATGSSTTYRAQERRLLVS